MDPQPEDEQVPHVPWPSSVGSMEETTTAMENFMRGREQRGWATGERQAGEQGDAWVGLRGGDLHRGPSILSQEVPPGHRVHQRVPGQQGGSRDVPRGRAEEAERYRGSAEDPEKYRGSTEDAGKYRGRAEDAHRYRGSTEDAERYRGCREV